MEVKKNSNLWLNSTSYYIHIVQLYFIIFCIRTVPTKIILIKLAIMIITLKFEFFLVNFYGMGNFSF